MSRTPTPVTDDVPEAIAKSYDRILDEASPNNRLSLHTPASIYQTQFRSMCAELVQNGGDIDYNGLFHHVSAQGAVVLMLAKRVLELEKVESELKAVKEMYNLP